MYDMGISSIHRKKALVQCAFWGFNGFTNRYLTVIFKGRARTPQTENEALGLEPRASHSHHSHLEEMFIV